MGMTVSSPRELAGGLVCIAIGALFLLLGRELELGSLFRMGPGFFPTVLAVILVLLGLAIAAGSLTGDGRLPTGLALRGTVLIVGAPILFGLTLRGLGLVPSVAGVVFIVSWASVRTRLWVAALLTIGLTAFCVLVFVQGIGLPIRLIGPWLQPAAAPAPPAPS